MTKTQKTALTGDFVEASHRLSNMFNVCERNVTAHKKRCNMVNSQMMTAGVTVATISVAATVGWICWSGMRWRASLESFHRQHHGYRTSAKKKEVLLIVCPASGGGKAMNIYTECVKALEQKGLHIETYVTSSANDLMNLTSTVKFNEYPGMIAVLAGDSSVYELIQITIKSHQGQWPFAPLLILPGGSGNVLSAEFHGVDTTIDDIVNKATVIRKGSILKCTCGGTTRFAVHTAFDGIQRLMIERVERYRSTLYAAFGEPAITALILYTFLQIPFMKKHNRTPIVLSAFNSDCEGFGLNYKFGVSTFDDTMIIIYLNEYRGLYSLLKFLSSLLSGQLAKDYRDQKTIDGATVKVTSKFQVQGDGQYMVFFDGTSQLSLQGDELLFEVISNAIPYFTFDETDHPAK